MSADKLEIYWNLGNLLYQKKILKVTEFQELLKLHGVSLSYSQTHALVNEQPVRVTLRTVMATCEILDCSVGDLIVIRPATAPDKGKDKTDKTAASEIKRIPKKIIGRKLKFD